MRKQTICKRLVWVGIDVYKLLRLTQSRFLMVWFERKTDMKVTLLTTVAIISFSATAFAQAVMVAPVPSGPTINGQPLVQIGLSFISDVGPVLLATVAAYLSKVVKNNILRNALIDATQRAAKGVYETLASAGANVGDISIKNAAIASAVNDVTANYPAILKTFGVTPDVVHNMIRKELGGLLAVDPTVTVSNNSPVVVAAPASIPVTVVGEK
jgi:hypothetical protein